MGWSEADKIKLFACARGEGGSVSADDVMGLLQKDAKGGLSGQLLQVQGGKSSHPFASSNDWQWKLLLPSRSGRGGEEFDGERDGERERESEGRQDPVERQDGTRTGGDGEEGGCWAVSLSQAKRECESLNASCEDLLERVRLTLSRGAGGVSRGKESDDKQVEGVTTNKPSLSPARSDSVDSVARSASCLSPPRPALSSPSSTPSHSPSSAGAPRLDVSLPRGGTKPDVSPTSRVGVGAGRERASRVEREEKELLLDLGTVIGGVWVHSDLVERALATLAVISSLTPHDLDVARCASLSCLTIACCI